MNSYLTPLVEELQQRWENGFSITTWEQVQVRLRVALSCTACDIPASRKVNGFLGHSASLACNKCLKVFTVTIGSPTYYSDCGEIMKETTKTGQRKKESEHGLRSSVLLSLPYFDPVCSTVIDTMHNFYLGTGKHAFAVWINKGLLSSDDLSKIER